MPVKNSPYRLFIKDSEGNLKEIHSLPKDKAVAIFNKDGVEMSRKTFKPKRNSGFAANKEKINKSGRPPGSKSKPTVAKAIERFEAYSIDAAEVILAAMLGNDEFFGHEVKPSERMSAAKYIIEAPRKLKTVEAPKQPVSGNEDEEEKEEEPRPLIQLQVTSDGTVQK